MFGIGIVTTAILTLLTPIAANTDYKLLIAVRVIEGLFEVRNDFERKNYDLSVFTGCHVSGRNGNFIEMGTTVRGNARFLCFSRDVIF